jgi:hypothetical protein
MTAEIIQFGKSQSATVRRQVTSPAARQQRRAPRVSEKVRFAFEGDLYEANFSGNNMQSVYAIHYRITAGGVQEMKRCYWNERYTDLDPAMVQAARSARGSDRKDADIPFREAAIAAFHKRRAKLISEVEKIDATLASMRCN